MPWAERGDRNRVGASVPALGLVKLVRALAYEGEIVQRAREVRVEGPEAEFLYGGGLTQQPLGFGIVGGSGGVLRRFEDGRRIEHIDHGSAAKHFKLLASRSKGRRGHAGKKPWSGPRTDDASRRRIAVFREFPSGHVPAPLSRGAPFLPFARPPTSLRGPRCGPRERFHL